MAARLILRNVKSVAGPLFRARPADLTEAAQNVAAVRSLLLLNRTPMTQFPVLSDSFPVVQPVFLSLSENRGMVYEEADRLEMGKMEAARGKQTVDEEDDEAEENDVDFDDVDSEDMDEEFDDIDSFDEDDDDDDDDDDEKYRRTRK